MVDTGLDSATISENAKNMLSSNEVSGDPSMNDEVLSLLLKKSIVYNDGPAFFQEKLLKNKQMIPNFILK